MSNSVEAFGEWQEDEPPLIGAGLGWEFPPDFQELLVRRGVAESEFRRVLCTTTEILFGSLFGAADEAGSRLDLNELTDVVRAYDVEWPPLSIFWTSQWSDGSGWGNIPTANEMASWRAATRSIKDHDI